MAEKKKNPTASRAKTTGKTSAQKHASAAARGNGKGAKRPIRREVGAFVCLFLSIIVILGLFQVDALLIPFSTDLIRGLIGAGIYLMPFALLLDFVILLFHDGRPVRLRVICTLLAALSIGMLAHLLSPNTISPSWGFPMVGRLWQTGVSRASGGLLAGMLAMLLELLVGKIFGVFLSLILLLLTTLTGLNMTVKSLFKAIRSRPRLEYDPPAKEHPDAAERLVHHVAQKQIQRKAGRITEFDLPVDDPPAAVPPAPQQKKKPPQKKQEIFLEQLSQYEEKTTVRSGTAASVKMPEAVPVPPKTSDQPLPPLILEQEESDNFSPEPPAAVPPPLVVKREKPEQASAVPLPEPPVQTLPEPAAPLEDPSRKVKKEEALLEAARIAMEIGSTVEAQKIYAYPPESLLHTNNSANVDGTEEMQTNADRLNDTLASFGIDAHIVNVIRGPSVTRYELELDRGVKLSKITNLSDDIALSLGAAGVRISAIPDKISVVGVEVPNKLVSTVRIRDVIDSVEFHKSKSRISFAVGKDISGKCIIGDIARLPHLLIAGTTGSGKSVCMNSLIISLLYKSKPEEVRLIMVDPKMVELGIYNGIPHLLIPVVTDPKKAAGALQWAVTEMMKRYRLMADAGVRDLDSYNKLCSSDPDSLQPMPQIVVVIDELADLMLVAAKEVEEAICRVAQMGRASGIHLVIATQRPSADVITGLMKANIPSRIAFAVASAMESRIILDTTGAEKLVGKGDMLYGPLGQGKPRRVQGCFITDDEVQAVVEYIKRNAAASYDSEVMEQIEQKAADNSKSSGSSNSAAAESISEGDELLPAAVDVILETGQASVSMLQRRLKLGYARAARIVDEMEEKGIVGPFEGSKPRQLLISRDQWLQMQGLAQSAEPLPQPEEPVPEEEP